MKNFIIKVKRTGVYWKAPEEGVTKDIKEAHIYKESELSYLQTNVTGLEFIEKVDSKQIEIDWENIKEATEAITEAINPIPAKDLYPSSKQPKIGKVNLKRKVYREGFKKGSIFGFIAGIILMVVIQILLK